MTVGVAVTVGVGVTVVVAVAVGVAVRVAVGVAVTVGVGVRVGVAVSTGVPVSVGVGVGVWVRVGVGVGVRVSVAVGVAVTVAVGVGVAVTVGVGVAADSSHCTAHESTPVALPFPPARSAFNETKEFAGALNAAPVKVHVCSPPAFAMSHSTPEVVVVPRPKLVVYSSFTSHVPAPGEVAIVTMPLHVPRL